jgi:eukaryotic-like serine/threonine-protein kinase
LTLPSQVSVTRLTFDAARERYPVWSPDSTRVLFRSQREAGFGLYEKSIGGVGAERLIQKASSETIPADWSPDSQGVLYVDEGDIWTAKDDRPIRFAKTDRVESQPQFSPDGRWIAYTSGESKRNEVYVESFPAQGGKWLISSAGGSQPRWRRDGKELFYLSLDNNLMSVSLKIGRDSFEVAEPQMLFQTRLPNSGVSNFHYSVTPDGQRFIIDGALTATVRPITVVTNWLSMLKR